MRKLERRERINKIVYRINNKGNWDKIRVVHLNDSIIPIITTLPTSLFERKFGYLK